MVDAFNAFVRLALAPAGIAVPELSELPPGREWFEFLDDHGLRAQWAAFVIALTQAQAMASATTAIARAKLRKEFAGRGSVQTQRALFLADVKRVLLGKMKERALCVAHVLPYEETCAIFASAHPLAGHLNVAARLSVQFGLFGDGQAKEHFKPGASVPKARLNRARNAFMKALIATRQ